MYVSHGGVPRHACAEVACGKAPRHREGFRSARVLFTLGTPPRTLGHLRGRVSVPQVPRCPGVQVGTGDGPEISPYCEQLSLTALHGESSAYESTSMSKDGGILHTMHVIGSMIQRCHPAENGAAKRPATPSSRPPGAR